jgi:hypothetical protein
LLKIVPKPQGVCQGFAWNEHIGYLLYPLG